MATLVCLLFPLKSQNPPPKTLEQGRLHGARIQGGEAHTFKVSLEANQFVTAQLIQNGVDVVITSYGPNGEELQEFDSPNGDQGPEMISFYSQDAGDYSLVVEPFKEDAEYGNYTMKINHVAPRATTKDGRVDELFASWDTDNSPGAAVAIVDDNRMVYSNGYGLSNLEYDIPIESQTVFHIASVSKQFTVFAILLLETQGKLSLEDDIRKHIPEVPDFGQVITLRHLAAHTSGLRDQWNLLALAGWRLDDVITYEHILKLVSKQKDLNFNPGEEFAYCNTGFTLLAEVVARVSEKSFAEFTQEEIFDPLGMDNTLFYDDHEKIVNNRAYSYRPDGGSFKKSVLSYANAGATSLFTTVEDLAKWAMNFKDPSVGTKDMITKMNTKAVLNNGKEFGGALGQFVEEYKGLNQVQHGGADAGYRTYLGRFPDQDFAVIVFSNLGSFDPGGMALKIADIYLEEEFAENVKQENNEQTSDPENIEIEEEILQKYVGRYELFPGLIITIFIEDGALYGQAEGIPQSLLTPLSTHEFDVEGLEAKIVFIEDGGSVESLTLLQGGQEMQAARMEEFDAESVDLAQFTGRFWSDELSTAYDLIVEEDQLIARHSRHSDIRLTPTKPDFFSGNQWYFGQLEFTRNDQGVIDGYKVSSGRVRNLVFTKK